MWNSLKGLSACLGSVSLLAGMLTGTGNAAEEEKVPLVFSGGHEIGRGDYGRPVPLIAAGLGVKPEEFRAAFSRVTPAKGRGPSRDEAQKNKASLMKVLEPLGVTNERLDEVSDYYRFQPQKGELWKATPARGYAVVEKGKVQKIVITEAGSGYSSPPSVTITGMKKIRLGATLHFDQDLKKNGSVESVEVVESKKKNK